MELNPLENMKTQESPATATAVRVTPAEPCPGSLWNVVIIQFQNAFLDKIVQYLLIGLALVLPSLSAASKELYPNLAALLLALPSILMAPTAGWLADRYSKRDVLLWCSMIQTAMLLLGAVALELDMFWASTVVFFFLGLQATVLGPAKGGIVKELVGDRHLTFANSWVNGTGLIAITLGPWFGGFLVKEFYPDNPSSPNEALVAPMAWLVAISMISLVFAWRLPKTPIHGESGPFRWSLLSEHFGNLADLLKQRHLRLPAFGVSFFWYAATLTLLLLLQAAKAVLPGAPESQAQLGGVLLVWVGIGIGLGSALVSLVSVERIELGLIPLGGLCLSVSSAGAALVDMEGWTFRILLLLIGIGSGVFLVPLNAYLQDQLDPAKRGRQLGASALLDSLAMAAAIVTQWVCKFLPVSLGMGVRLQFLLQALLCLLAAIYVVRIIPQNFFRFVLLSIVKIVYRVKVNHIQRIPREGGVLLLSNHVSYIDAFVIAAACDRRVRFIANDQFHRMPFIGWFLKLFDVVPVSPKRAKDAIVTVADTVKQGRAVCLFPEGQLTRTGFTNEIRKGFELMARRSGQPVVPLYMDDLWGSIFSFERGRFLGGKWPHHFAYRVTVLAGEPIPAQEATTEKVRQVWRGLAAEAMQNRGELRPRIEEAVVRSLARHPWKLGWIGRTPMSRGNLLAYSELLARKWTNTLLSHRVGIIAGGKNAVLANLSLRLAGFAPVNINVPDQENLEAALIEHGITTLLVDEMDQAPQCEQLIDLPAAIAEVDNFRLILGIVTTYLTPKALAARKVRQRRMDELPSHEAVGWLRVDGDGQIRYHSMTHRQLLAQSEQLRNVDSCREGDTVCSPHGYANVEGTVLGFWNALLTGAALCASIREADLVVTDRPAWDALQETGVDASKARAVFLCGDQADLLGLEPSAETRVMPCLVPNTMERFVAMSLPHPAIPTKTAEHQDGWKPNALGRLLPGFQVTEGDKQLHIVGPDGATAEIHGIQLDAEEFLVRTNADSNNATHVRHE
jgi:acyl-[acyl-carrier-protein]-phospholipid O-acyltransferase / long-chain-fatty-acid--[acyl-carrier-protein] ligase